MAQNSITGFIECTGECYTKLPKPYSKRKLNINSLEHLSYRIGFTISELEKVASRAESLYNFVNELKKSGGFREISKPHYRLKTIQHSIHKLLQEITISNSAHGGIKCKSSLTNAKIHCAQKFLLKLDLKNYFPNISHHAVFNMFHKKLGCSPPVASLLTRLTTVKKQVPQGGSTSTDIANIVFRDTDARLEGLAKKFGLNYTRYVDDICFSGKDIPEQFTRSAEQIIENSGFVLNSQKKLLLDGSMPKIITGLSVNRKKPNVPRNIRREVRKQTFILRKHKVPDLSEAEQNILEKRIKGKEAYIRYINKNK